MTVDEVSVILIMNEKGSSFIRKRVENHLIEHRKSMVFVHTSWSHPMIR